MFSAPSTMLLSVITMENNICAFKRFPTKGITTMSEKYVSTVLDSKSVKKLSTHN